MLQELQKARQGNFIDSLFPDEGPLRRELYEAHLKFFDAGRTERERAFMAANRVGKTTSGGGYEMAVHLMGLYPPWWTGRRFDHPVKAWACGDTNETVREIIQPVLFGQAGQIGTGLIREHTIAKVTSRRGSVDAIESARITHASGGESVILFKSYEQGRKAFQGTKQDLIWCDEEPSMALYAEMLLRLTATKPDGSDWGSMIATFTPLLGISEVVMHFLGGAEVAPAPQPRVVTEPDEVPTSVIPSSGATDDTGDAGERPDLLGDTKPEPRVHDDALSRFTALPGEPMGAD